MFRFCNILIPCFIPKKYFKILFFHFYFLYKNMKENKIYLNWLNKYIFLNLLIFIYLKNKENKFEVICK